MIKAARAKRQELEKLLEETDRQAMELQRAKDEADGEIAGLAPCPGADPGPKSPLPTLVDSQPDTMPATEEEVAKNLQQPEVTQEAETTPRPVATPTRSFQTRRTFGGSVWEDAQGQPEDSPALTPTELETPLKTGTPSKTPATDDGGLGSPCRTDGYEDVLVSSPDAATGEHVTGLYRYTNKG